MQWTDEIQYAQSYVTELKCFHCQSRFNIKVTTGTPRPPQASWTYQYFHIINQLNDFEGCKSCHSNNDFQNIIAQYSFPHVHRVTQSFSLLFLFYGLELVETKTDLREDWWVTIISCRGGEGGGVLYAQLFIESKCKWKCKWAWHGFTPH